ncbi:MAG TPA: DUF6176 family protein [bacterium]|nr:DUF6176 family protein [bacterium]
MSEARLLKFRFKSGGKKKWIDWCAALKRRSHEVFETLNNEGVIAEACFLAPEEDAIYYFVAADDLERAERAAQRSTYVIDQEHAQVKSAALECVERLECLFFFDNR